MTDARERHLKRIEEDRKKGLDDLDEAQLKKGRFKIITGKLLDEEKRLGIVPLDLTIARRYDGGHPDPSKWTAAMRQEVATSLDGDGCLSIGFDKRAKTYGVGFQFKGSSKLPIFLAEKYGGTCFYTKSDGSFSWRVDRQEDLAACLKSIKPYVREKTGQVDVALKALKILKEKPRGWRDRLEALRQEMGRLNNTEDRKQRGLEYWEATDPSREA